MKITSSSRPLMHQGHQEDRISPAPLSQPLLRGREASATASSVRVERESSQQQELEPHFNEACKTILEYLNSDTELQDDLLAVPDNEGRQVHHKRQHDETQFEKIIKKTKAFDRLMNWFVGGMSGYAGAMTAVAISKVAALLAGAAVALDWSGSSAAIAGTTIALLGIYAFVGYHSKIHKHFDSIDSDVPAVDLNFMRRLFAKGGSGDGIQYAVDALRFIEGKEERRQDYLHDMAKMEGVRFDGIKIYSIDKDEVIAKRKEQKGEAGNNEMKRFLARHGLTSKNMKSRAKASGNFISTAIGERSLHGAKKEAKETFARETDFLIDRRLADSAVKDTEHTERTSSTCWMK